MSGPSAQGAPAELTMGCCVGSKQDGKTQSPGPQHATRHFPTQLFSEGGVLVESFGLLSWDLRTAFPWSRGQDCTGGDPVAVVLPGRHSCLCPGWEQTFRPILRPHWSRPSPSPVPSGKGGCPKESKGLRNACPGVRGTWGFVCGDPSPQLTVYTSPHPQLFCLPESSCLSSEMATTT